jgi:DNA invertase Pin-like site-specific DNA recombinase
VEKVERQEADCRELADRLGWSVSEAHIFPDNSRSAWQRNRRRPQWDRMLKAVEAGEIDGILVYHGDRLIRQPVDLEMLISIADRGLRIASPSGTRDLDNPDDRFILRIEAAQACRASDDTSRRVRRGVMARVSKGLPGTAGGKRPYGWGVKTGERTKTHPQTGEQIAVPTYDTSKPVDAEIKFIRQGVERMLAGMDQGAVIRWLNSNGSRTTEGNPWTAKSWRNVMMNPRVAGLIEHGGQLYDAVWDGALTIEEWEAVKGIYLANAVRYPYQGRSRKHLLSGVAECYRCHKPQQGPVAEATKDCTDCPGPHVTLRAKPSGGRNRKTSRLYYCPSCRGVGRNLELLDAYVEGRVLQLLGSPRFAEQLHASFDQSAPDLGGQIRALEERKAQTRRQLEELADNPDVDPALALMAISSFDKKIAELRSRVAASGRIHRLARLVGITREEWRGESIDTRSAVVSDLFRVVVLPATWRGPGFSPSSVRLERRSLEAQED